MKLFLTLLFATVVVFAGEPKVIPIWPGAAPGAENWNWQETETIGPKDTIRRIGNVTRPTLTVYLPEPGVANGTGIVVAPGGGFRILAIDYEGHDVARWLVARGVAAFVLKYRVMRTGEPEDKAGAQERRKQAMEFCAADGLQAMKVVRAHAAEWHIAADRIGIMGFSAGGYLTASVALHYDAQSRPNFAAPIYPLAPEEIKVPDDAPPLFICQADDDKSLPTVKNSIRLYTAWKEAGKPAEMHIYARGGHGFGMKKLNLPVDTWIDRFGDWLDMQGLLKAAK